MLDPYTNYNGIFVEITKSEHGHGGPGWELGTCLWSPTRNQAGHDRYALMREPVRGSLVLHAYHDHWPEGATETRICSRSIVSQPHKEVIEEPPSPGSWADMSPYYRIDLEGYEQFATPLPISRLLHDYGGDIRYDLKENQPGYYPFATYRDTVRTVQGIYLARCTVGLYQIIGMPWASKSPLLPRPNRESSRSPNIRNQDGFLTNGTSSPATLSSLRRRKTTTELCVKPVCLSIDLSMGSLATVTSRYTI
jgi:hypothetical protein